jgi:small-conductance mechanosensitive channel
MTITKIRIKVFLFFLFIDYSFVKNSIYIKKEKYHELYILRLIYLNYMELQDLIFIIIAILIAVVLLKIFMWLLPVIVVLVIAFFIYIFLQDRYNY